MVSIGVTIPGFTGIGVPKNVPLFPALSGMPMHGIGSVRNTDPPPTEQNTGAPLVSAHGIPSPARVVLTGGHNPAADGIQTFGAPLKQNTGANVPVAHDPCGIPTVAVRHGSQMVGTNES